MKKLSGAPKWLIEITIHWPIFFLALWLSDSFFDGIYFQNIESIFIGSFLLTTLNLFIKPIILLLALPLALLSLGLIIPFLNGLFILLVAKLVDGFYVDSYLTSVIVAMCVSFFSVLAQIALGKTGASINIKNNKRTFNDTGLNKEPLHQKNIIDVEVKEKKQE